MVSGAKITTARNEKNFSQAELGLKMGVSQGTISAWEKNTRGLSALQLEQLSQVLNKPADYFIEPKAGKEISSDPSEKFVKIGIYAAEASAGHGCINDNETIENYLIIDRELVKSELQCNSNNLAIVRVRGDSMTPTIKPGEMVVIDKTVNTIVSDGLYVMRMTGDVIVVKRVQTLPKSLNIISDNKAYPPYQISFEDAEGLAVIGRVMAIISIERVGA